MRRLVLMIVIGAFAAVMSAATANAASVLTRDNAAVEYDLPGPLPTLFSFNNGTVETTADGSVSAVTQSGDQVMDVTVNAPPPNNAALSQITSKSLCLSIDGNTAVYWSQITSVSQSPAGWPFHVGDVLLQQIVDGGDATAANPDPDTVQTFIFSPIAQPGQQATINLLGFMTPDPLGFTLSGPGTEPPGCQQLDNYAPIDLRPFGVPFAGPIEGLIFPTLSDGTFVTDPAIGGNPFQSNGDGFTVKDDTSVPSGGGAVSPGGSALPASLPLAPVVSNAKASKRCVRSATIALPQRSTSGLAFSYDLSEAANVMYVLKRQDGSRERRVCPFANTIGEALPYLPISIQNSPGLTGPNSVSLGTASSKKKTSKAIRRTAQAKAGRNVVRLSQLAGPGTQLQPGTYVLMIRATNSSGQQSIFDINVKFWVLR